MFNFTLSGVINWINIQLIRVPAIVIALTVHEFSHAAAAYYLGDRTAKNLGRLSLNPIRHLDPIGLICLVFLRFGWAKPVPVNPYNFRKVDEKTGMMLTSLAGPMSNIALCFIFVGLLSFLSLNVAKYFVWLYSLFFYLIIINASQAFFNMIPVPPLDGSKVLFSLLPDRYYYLTRYLDQYGFIFLMLLLTSKIPELILGPLTIGLINSFEKFFSLFI